MEDIKPYKKKMVRITFRDNFFLHFSNICYIRQFEKVQIKVKKQDDEELDDGESQVYIANDDADSFNVTNEMYVIEPCDGNESDGDEYVEFELENSKADDRNSIESLEDNSLLTPTDYEYVRKPPIKRRRDSNTNENSSTSPSYKRIPIDRSLIDFQKKLMQMEYDDMKKLRHEKHQLEIAILKADLTHKTLEHQKQMELLNKKLQD